MKATQIHPKVQAAGAIGTPLAVVLVWLAGVVGLDMGPEVAAALAALVAGLVGYLTPSTRIPKNDAGESPAGVLWTIFLVLAIVALVMWIL